MAGKQKIVYTCTECGAHFPKWAGRCAQCGEWNTLTEEIESPSVRTGASVGRAEVFRIDAIDTQAETRYPTGMGELDRVLGGGIVPGGLMLISGDPGIGKSTLLLQICGYLSQKYRVLYASGEESARQIKLRAERLGVFVFHVEILMEFPTALGDRGGVDALTVFLAQRGKDRGEVVIIGIAVADKQNFHGDAPFTCL